MFDHEYLETKVRLKHPVTGAFLGAFYPETNELESQNKRLAVMINLKEVKYEWEKRKTVTDDTSDA